MTETFLTGYTDEKNIQILIALMKHHGVRQVVASPGATNITFVASIQQDPYFTLYSSVDERSAAYIACGLAAESGEPVALSCTGATASRNYLPGLTEAFYRKLPILAITATQHLGRIGHMVPQVIDRTNELNDICRLSIQCPSVYSDDDRWACEANLNRALLELTRDGGGPVHVNMVTTYSTNFNVKELPSVHYVDRIEINNEFPSLAGRKIAIFVGNHQKWSRELTSAVETFCDRYDAVVICDHTSNYSGRFRIDAALVCSQMRSVPAVRNCDVLIHIGEVSGSYIGLLSKEVWRVDPEGIPRDSFRKLRYVFDMYEEEFFKKYSSQSEPLGEHSYFDAWCAKDAAIRSKIPELPFSNPWIAQQLGPMLPTGSVLHLGILNSLRGWNLFPLDSSISCYCNTGGFGIDGCVSSLVGASLASPDKLFFGVVGDLAMFYDLNSLGNRHIGSNIRLMVINNGVGTEFKNFNHKAARFGVQADAYMAARGHYGAQSRDLLRHYAEDLGFEYLSASSKEELLVAAKRFAVAEKCEKPMLLEVFTDSKDESDALEILYSLEVDAKGTAKQVVKNLFGEKGVAVAKKALGR